MASSSTTAAQYTQQFLNTVLSQRGLPYSEDVKWFIRQHLLSLTSTYPSLHPKTAIFTHNDGRSVNLLQADGTIPITFNTLTYNIPVLIWLMDTYPRHPPLVFVNPTRDMIIKRHHAFVNPSGLVSMPYLQNWVYPSSNLVDLARNLSHYFGLDPPLYSQQRRPNPNPNPSFDHSVSSGSVRPAIPSVNPNPSFDHSVSSGSVRPAIPSVNPNPNPSFDHSVSSGSIRPAIPSVNPNPSFDHSVSSGSVRPAIPPRSYPPSPYGGGGVEDPSEVYKRNAIGKLVESVHSDVEELRRKREVEMEGMFNVQSVLRRRGEEVAEGVREMEYEKEGLEQKLQMVLMNTDVLEGWLRVNDGKLSGVDAAANVDVDEAFEASDALSKQMMDCTAADLAIEDVVYALDKAVQEGSVAFDVYLRNVRLLSREQFFHRAMAAKVRGVQMQGYVTSMASRVSPSYGM